MGTKVSLKSRSKVASDNINTNMTRHGLVHRCEGSFHSRISSQTYDRNSRRRCLHCQVSIPDSKRIKDIGS